MAARRINPKLSLPEVSARTRAITAASGTQVATPRPDMSIATGLSELSRGLSKYVEAENDKLRVNDQLEKDAAFVQVQNMTEEEVKRGLLNEEGKSILEGQAPQRQYYIQEFAGQRFADEHIKSSLYDPELINRLTDPTNTNVDISAELRAIGLGGMDFSGAPDSVTFQRAAQVRALNKVEQRTETLMKQRASKVLAYNQQQAVATAAKFLDSYALSDKTDAYEVFELKMDTLKAENEVNTGEDVIDSMWQGVDLNISAELGNNLQKNTDLHGLREQLEAAKTYSEKNRNFNLYREQHENLLNQLDAAEERQENWNLTEEGRREQLDRTRANNGFLDDVNRWLGSMDDATRQKTLEIGDSKLWDQYIATLGDDKDKVEEAVTRFNSFQSMMNQYRSAQNDPQAGDRKDSAATLFMSEVWNGKYPTIDSAIAEMNRFSAANSLSFSQHQALRREVTVWGSHRERITKVVSSIATPSMSVTLQNALNSLGDELSSTLFGKDLASALSEAAENPDIVGAVKGMQTTLEAVEAEVAGIIAAELTLEVASYMAENPEVSPNEAAKILSSDGTLDSLIHGAVSEFKRRHSWDDARTEENRQRILMDSRRTELENNPTGVVAQLLDNPELSEIGLPILKEAADVLSNPTLTPEERNKEWTELQDSYTKMVERLYNFGVDVVNPNLAATFPSRRNGAKLLGVNYKDSLPLTKAYFAMRSLGVDPYRPDELAYMLDFHEAGIGVQTVSGLEFAFDYTQSLYFLSMDDLKSSGLEKVDEYITQYRRVFNTNKTDGQLRQEFVDNQRRLLLYYGRN